MIAGVDYDGFDHIDVEISDAVAMVRIGDPMQGFLERSHPMHMELVRLFWQLRIDESISGILVTGAGPNFFTGPSLPELKTLTEDPVVGIQLMRQVRYILDNVLSIDKPMVAAVNGPAFGIGSQIAFLSDILIACPEARFQDRHVDIGLAAGDGGPQLWPVLLGFARARYHLLTGQPLDLEMLRECGIITEMVAKADVIVTAEQWLERLMRLPSLAFRSTKASILQTARLLNLVAGEFGNALETGSFLSPDYHEAMKRAIESK